MKEAQLLESTFGLFKMMAEKYNVSIGKLNIHIEGGKLYVQKYTPGQTQQYDLLELIDLNAAYLSKLEALSAIPDQGWMDKFLESVPDASNATSEDKEEFVKNIMMIISKPLLATFVMLGLKTEMTCGVINEYDNQLFELSFKKIGLPNPPSK